MDFINWGMASLLGGIALGYWLRGQSVSTIEADIASIKTEIVNIKNYFKPTPAPVVVSAQVPAVTPAA